MDKFGNKIAQEGCDRCDCGCKYWENDVCVSCGRFFSITVLNDMLRNFPEGWESEAWRKAMVKGN